jgi:uncharacterized protein (TIGR03435 family)
MTATQFAASLNHLFVELPPVLDLTGIAGRYDMTINFSPRSGLQNMTGPGAGGEAVPSEPDGTISLFEALHKQFGLKLQPHKVMAPLLIIDHVDEMPSEN